MRSRCCAPSPRGTSPSTSSARRRLERLDELVVKPTVVDGRLEPRHVDLRPSVVGGCVLPLALSRFAQAAGELVVNCAQGGGGKDVWVLAD